MEEAIPRIAPRVVDLARDVRAAEITLGGIPRGAVVVLCDAGRLAGAAEPMNALAGHGYETVAAEVANGAADVAGGLLAHLADRGWEPEQVGVVGYGAGGRAALLTATEFALGAAVSVTAASYADPGEPLRTPWLGLCGGDPVAARRLDTVLYQRSPVYTQVVWYPDLDESFSGEPAEAAAHAAAFDAWQRTAEWLDLRVVPRPTPLALAWRARQPAGVGVP